MAWLRTVLIESCTIVHYVSLLSCYAAYCFATIILLFHCHAALPPSYCFASFTLLWLCHISCFAFVTLRIVCHCCVALFRSCCFAFHHAALPLSCCFASVLLFFLCHATLPLSCAALTQSVVSGFVILFCLCHARFFACVMLLCPCHNYCFDNIFLLAIVGLLDSTLQPSLPYHPASPLSFCPAIVMLPYPYHGLDVSNCPLPCHWSVILCMLALASRFDSPSDYSVHLYVFNLSVTVHSTLVCKPMLTWSSGVVAFTVLP